MYMYMFKRNPPTPLPTLVSYLLYKKFALQIYKKTVLSLWVSLSFSVCLKTSNLIISPLWETNIDSGNHIFTYLTSFKKHSQVYFYV